MADRATVQPTPRKTLLEWIDDDGDETADPQPAGGKAVQEFHARVVAGPERGREDAEPLLPPTGLRLAPLG